MLSLPALAYGFADTFKIRDIAGLFAGAKLRQSKKQLVAEYGPDTFVVAFDFGALVFINVPAEERTRVLGGVLGKIAQNEPHPPLEEDFVIAIDPSAPGDGVVHFDRVVVPNLDLRSVEVITLLLAQSVSIDYYEEDLREILAELDRRTRLMIRTGRIPASTRPLTRFVGSSIETKNQIIEALALLDKPAITWESESHDRLYRELRQILEIDDRFRSLEYKLRTIQESLELLLDLAQTRRMLLLETTIVVLIVFEIAMSLVQLL